MKKTAFLLSFLVWFANCSLLSTSDTGSGGDTSAGTDRHYNFDDARAYILMGGGTEAFSEQFGLEHVSIYKFTSEYELEPAYWYEVLDPDALTHENHIRTTEYSTDDYPSLSLFKQDGQIYFIGYGDVDEEECGFKRYDGPDLSTCVIDQMSDLGSIENQGFDEAFNFYFVDLMSSGDLMKTSTDGNTVILADFASKLVSKFRVDAEGNILVQANDDQDDDYATRELYFIFADGTLVEVSDTLGLRSSDIYSDSDGSFWVLGINDGEGTQGLYTLTFDQSNHTVQANLAATYVTGDTNLGDCSFIPDLNYNTNVMCNGVGTIIGLPDAALLVPHGQVVSNSNFESLRFARDGYLYAILSQTPGSPQGVEDEADYEYEEDTDDAGIDLDETDDLLAKISLSDGSSDTTWSSGEGDLLAIRSFWVDEDGIVYYVGECNLGEGEEIGGGDTITGACIGYFNPATGEFTISASTDAYSTEGNRVGFLGYWEFP